MTSIFLNKHLTDELIIRLIKILDIFSASFIYIISAFIVSFFLDRYIFPEFDDEKEKEKHFVLSVTEICVIVGVLGIIAYIARNLIQMIPFPFEGLYGFKHLMVNEVRSGSLFSAYIILLNSYLQKKLSFIKNRFTDIANKK